MRDYGKVSPAFWTGKTGKSIRGDQEAQIVALYLMTSPHANMIGVYHLPMLYLSHETGLSLEGASKGLARCIEGGFCTYDSDAELVFVSEMAAHQVGEALKREDKRVKCIQKQYAAISQAIVGKAFFARYATDFHLPADTESTSPFEAPSKPVAVAVAVAVAETGAIELLASEHPQVQSAPDKPATPLPAKERRKPERTLADWLVEHGDADAVPADDPLFGWAKDVGIPRHWIALAWWAFEGRYADNPKTYRDWRAAFRDHVRGDYLKLWRADRDGQWFLTTAGKQTEREMAAQVGVAA